MSSGIQEGDGVVGHSLKSSCSWLPAVEDQKDFARERSINLADEILSGEC